MCIYFFFVSISVNKDEFSLTEKLNRFIVKYNFAMPVLSSVEGDGDVSLICSEYS